MNSNSNFDDSFFKTIVSTSNFWNRFRTIENVGDNIEDNWISKVSLLDQVSAQNNVAVFLYNTFRERFIFMSDKMKVLGGYEPELYTSENGLSFTFSNFVPNQVHAVVQTQSMALDYFMKNNNIAHTDIIINCNYLYKNKNGQYFQFLQQMIVVQTDASGRPLLILSFGHNISHIKKVDSMGVAFVTPTNNELHNYNPQTDKFDKMKPFSKQEMTVLKLLGQGMDSKQIADQLFISPHTVDTHRRNLINKTNCIDTTGVVTYARMINLI